MVDGGWWLGVMFLLSDEVMADGCDLRARWISSFFQSSSPAAGLILRGGWWSFVVVVVCY
jgi:hypothetical protein